MKRRTVLLTLASTLALPSAFAQRNWGRLLVGFSAGAGLDGLARKLVEAVPSSPNEPGFVVHNVVGAAGKIATMQAMESEPDGRTLLITPSSVVSLLPYIGPDDGFNPLDRLTPVASMGSVLTGIAVGPAISDINTLDEYVAAARRNPQKYGAYGTPGAGTGAHFLGMNFSKAAQLELLHVPYKGASPAISDLLGGQIPAYIGSIGPTTLEHIKAGRLRLLGLASEQRSRIVPTCPTLAELGYPKVIGNEWVGVFAPKATPAPVLAAVNARMQQAIDSQNTQKYIADAGMEMAASQSISDLQDKINKESALWKTTVKDFNFQMES